MKFEWFNSREAAQIGESLADDFAPRAASSTSNDRKAKVGAPAAIDELLRRADCEVRSLDLNFFKKAKFANSFKWRLIENGVARETADAVTQSLLLHLGRGAPPPVTSRNPTDTSPDPQTSGSAKQLFSRGNECLARGSYTEACELFRASLEVLPGNAETLHNLGVALSKLGLFDEAEQYLRQAIASKPDFPEAHCNLGIVLRGKSEYAESEIWLRHALKLRPNYVDARIHHAVTLLNLGRLREANARLGKVLKASPHHPDASLLKGEIARLEGRFEEAEDIIKKTQRLHPQMALAWAALAIVRRMTEADSDWFKKAKALAESGISPLEEAGVRYALGKYCDDIDDYDQAFRHYKRANELMGQTGNVYERDERTRLVDDLIRAYSRDAISKIQGTGSASTRPVFVVGMPRSGTSLAEQIIASHPAAYGAGELPFWTKVLVRYENEIRRGTLSESTRMKLAEEYLRLLEGLSGDAVRIIDKAPVNSDYLGIIYTVFPNARVIYMRRDPVDTCLSCYFQNFTGHDFTHDLADLVHYYQGHQRLMARWREVLPPDFVLEVPYEELIADQEAWSRKMLSFIGLEWDDRCLQFHETPRQVVTASAWQVRQKIYSSSVARWRNYEKFLGPLKELRK